MGEWQKQQGRGGLALASNTFGALVRCGVGVRYGDDFPVPQGGPASSLIASVDKCLISWWEKLLPMQSDGYKQACYAAPPDGWATKEQYRRPNVASSNGVRSVLRVCFDATPRMGNYEIHKWLPQQFKLGSNVLRIG